MLSPWNILDWADFEIDSLQDAAILLDEHTVFTNRTVPLGFLKSNAELHVKTSLDHSQQIQTRVAGKWIQKWPRLPDELDNFKPVIDDDAGRRIAVQEHLLPDFLQIRLFRYFGMCVNFVLCLEARYEVKRDRGLHRLLHIDSVLLVQ